jgi:hypothetical protein
MQHESADIPAWAYTMGLPALLVAAATPPLLILNSLLPPNMVWLCHLLPVVLASVRWGFAGAGASDVLLMRRKNHNRVERNLLTDIRDEAAHLAQLLTDATSASGASVNEPPSRPHW